MAEAVEAGGSGVVDTLGEGVLVKRGGFIEAGPTRHERVPLTSIVVFPQIRKKMAQAGIEELAQAMLRPSDENEDADKPAFEIDLQNPPHVALLDPEQLAEYRLELAQFWEVEEAELSPIESLPTHEIDGREFYVVLFSGHRRHAALHEIAERHGEDPSILRVQVVPHAGISFDEALIEQMRENIHERPDPRDEAIAIRAWFNLYAEQHGAEPTRRMMSRKLGYSETKISDALNFTESDPLIQSLVSRGHLSYSLGLGLAQVFKAQLDLFEDQLTREKFVAETVYMPVYVDLSDDEADKRGYKFIYTEEQVVLDTPEARARYELMTFIMTTMAARLSGGAMTAVNNQIAKLREQKKSYYEQPTMGYGDTDEESTSDVVTRRAAASRKLAKTAVASLLMALKADPRALSPEEHSELAKYLGAVPGTADLALKGLLVALRSGEVLAPEDRLELLSELIEDIESFRVI